MAFGGGFNRDEIISEINMTPLVDVMLVLLIIFIITVPVLTHSLEIELPRVQNKSDEVKLESISLSITSDEKIYWNDELVSRSELLQRLSISSQQIPQPELQLLAARNLEYEVVLQLMSQVQQAGIQKLGFVTQQ